MGSSRGEHTAGGTERPCPVCVCVCVGKGGVLTAKFEARSPRSPTRLVREGPRGFSGAGGGAPPLRPLAYCSLHTRAFPQMLSHEATWLLWGPDGDQQMNSHQVHPKEGRHEAITVRTHRLPRCRLIVRAHRSWGGRRVVTSNWSHPTTFHPVKFTPKGLAAGHPRCAPSRTASSTCTPPSNCSLKRGCGGGHT